MLLQTQGPGVGTVARNWRSEAADVADPPVIEALDPTVFADAVACGVDKHLESRRAVI